MRNNGEYLVPKQQLNGLLPIVSHIFINLSNIPNILRYFYGRTHL